MTNLVNKVNDHVVFLDTHAVKVFSHGESELILALATSFPTADHGRRVYTNTARLGEDPLAVWVGEGSRGTEVVFAAVGVEDVSFEGSPVKLQNTTFSNACNKGQNGF